MNVTQVSQAIRKKPVFIAIGGALLLGVIVALFSVSGENTAAVSYYEVKRGDFLISIVEAGTLEALNEEVIRSEVEGTARIIYIVPEGTYVKKGELLVQLDSSATEDAVNQQLITVEKNQFALIQAEQQLDIQKSTVESDVRAAELKVQFAQLDLDKYMKGEARQLERNAEIEITNVLETLQIAKERLEWTRRLHTNGFETKANLDKDWLAVSQGQLKLEQAQNALLMLKTFDQPKKEAELKSALKEAEENLARVKRQGSRIIAQYEADVSTQKRTVDLSKAKLARDQKQLEATKVYAPQDGLVVYASGGGGGRFSNESMIEEGAVVRYRQELIKLPDVADMKLQVRIHETHINHVQPGQPAFVVLDSMPDQRFRGVVNRVAPLPDGSMRWGNPNLKVYATEILVTDKLPDVKPGVSARAEVVITNLHDVVTVPIQAITTRKGKQVVFLADNPQKPVPVSVGMYNTKFIEVVSGLNPSDRVLLSPPFDADEKDLGGAVLASDEPPPAWDTNQMARAMQRARPANGTPTMDASPRLASSDRPAREPGAGTPSGREGNSPGESGRRQRGEGGSGFSDPARREAMMKEFDTNGDGQLDETERAALRERFGGRRRQNTNAVPEQPLPAGPDGSR